MTMDKYYETANIINQIRMIPATIETEKAFINFESSIIFCTKNLKALKAFFATNYDYEDVRTTTIFNQSIDKNIAHLQGRE